MTSTEHFPLSQFDSYDQLAYEDLVWGGQLTGCERLADCSEVASQPQQWSCWDEEPPA